MVRGRIAKTLAHLDELVVLLPPKSRLEVRIRYVVFAHNEHELPLMQERFANTPIKVEASPMRVDMRNEILRPASINIEEYSDWIPNSSRFYDKDEASAPRAPIGCNLPFEQMVIDVNGSVSLCCSSYDTEHDVGNVLRASVESVWNGPQYQAARRVVTGRGLATDNVVCRTCKANGYRDF